MNEITNFIPKKITTFNNTIYDVHKCKESELLPVSKNKKIVVPKNSIGLWYTTPVFNQFGPTKGKIYHSLIIPNNIKNVFLVSGLFKAETDLNLQRNRSSIDFVNTEPQLINLVTKWFEQFNVMPSDWSWRITFNRKLKNYYNQLFLENSARYFWINSTKIDPNKNIRIWTSYQGSYNGDLHPKTVNWGSLKINYNNMILRQIITNLINYTEGDIKKKDKKYIIEYLRGIFAAEACVLPKSNSIEVGVKKINDRKKIKSLLLKVGINYGKDDEIIGKIRIHNVFNLYQVYKYDLLRLHPHRKYLLLKCLLKIKQFQGEAKIIRSEFEENLDKLKNELESLSCLLENRTKKWGDIYKEVSKNKTLSRRFYFNKFERTAPTQYLVGKEIVKNPGLTATEIKIKTKRMGSSVEHAIIRLENRNLISKIKNKEEIFRIYPKPKLKKLVM